MSVFNNFVPQKEGSTNLSYSEFINQVKDNQIESVMIEADGKTISGTYKNGTKFLTYGLNDPKLVDDLLANNIEILKNNFPEIDFKITCSKGTYIRTIANDFGKNLNTGAFVKHLERFSIGDYNINKSISINEFKCSN